MSINELLRNAILPIVPICEPHSYDGDAPVYCVFNYSILPGMYADGVPLSMKYLMQLHLYVPIGQNPLGLISEIGSAIQRAGFPCPEIQDESDSVSQHYVFAFSHVVCESDVISSEQFD